MVLEKLKITTNRLLDKQISFDEIESKNGISLYKFNYKTLQSEVPEKCEISFFIPCKDMYSVWSPLCFFQRGINPDWHLNRSTSRAAAGAPIISLISQSGKNRFTMATSDVLTPIELSVGLREEDSTIICRVVFFTIPIAKLDKYEATVRFDFRDIAFNESIEQTEKWWEELGYKSGYVPFEAKEPMYSTWYSFHQMVNVDEIVKQCIEAKKYGMKTVIVDDGWQTDNNARGYEYCGDWLVCNSKVSDMKCFVKRIHAAGLKYMMWYSVPFVGEKCEVYKRFEGMYLDKNQKGWCCLDPRYKEVRNYLTEIYVNAVRDWDLDGLKLDFIDAMQLTDVSMKEDDRRDFTSLENAIECLLNEITCKVKKIKPEILLEFRQCYIGPIMKKYGNMLRVGDCPNDAIRNRMGAIDLRMTSGKCAVHSDMLMWNYSDSVESAAKQVISTLLCVPQISIRFEMLSEEQKKMLKFYMNFWHEYKETLINKKLIPYNPESNYSGATALSENIAITVCYTKTLIEFFENKENIIVNGTGETKFVVLSNKEIQIKYSILNCQGEIIKEQTETLKNDANLFEIPESGMIKFIQI